MCCHAPYLHTYSTPPLSSHPTTTPPPLSFPQDVKPFMVDTAMTRPVLAISSVETSRLIPDPVTYTRAAVATIGIQHTTYGYFYHALQVRISVAMVTDSLLIILCS